MAASNKAPKSGDSLTFRAGPFKRVRSTPNPFDDQGPEVLSGAVNMYGADSMGGGGFYMRPGTTRPASTTGTAPTAKGGHMHVAADGTVYNFWFINEKVYRWSAMGASLTDVTPTGVTISTAGEKYAVSLAGVMVVTDALGKSWTASSLGSTPIVGTYIEQQTPSVLLSRGATDTALANAAFTYSERTGAGYGTQTTKALNSTGTAVGALGQIAIGTWGIILVELTTATGAFVFTAAFNAGAGYATEALAIAALPARTVTRWYVGYVTVRADAGAVWIAGTDAFAGGTTGNQAQTTNYYAGEGPAYSVFGQPVIYYGAVFWIYEQVEATYARTTIGWSEPNEPTVGYQQTDYDNQWTLTQTSSNPLYVLIATNDALYYFREGSIGAVAGAPGVNFQGTATHDIVAGNVGCTWPRSAQLFRNVIYFADAYGRLWRFVVGGTTEPLWLQNQTVFDAVQQDPAQPVWAAIEPNLNLYVLNLYLAGTRVTFVFDAVTGDYYGTWEFAATMLLGTPMRDATSTASGNVHLGMLQITPDAVNIYAWKLLTVQDNTWTDNGGLMSNVTLTTGKLGYDAMTAYDFSVARAIVGFASGGTPTVGLIIGSSQMASTTANGQLISTPPELPLYRLWWSLATVTGRDGSMAFLADSPTRQLRFYRAEIDATVKNAPPTDW